MKFAARIGETTHEVVVDRVDALYRVELGGTVHLVDARKLEADFYSILFEGRSYEVSVEATDGGYTVRHGAHERQVELADASRGGREELARKGGAASVVSVMPGKIVRVLVAAGDAVEEGQGLVVVEAMKMENEIAAPRGGRVKEVAVTPGQAVESGAVLLVLH